MIISKTSGINANHEKINREQQKNKVIGWGCSPIGEHLPSMCKTLGTSKKKKKGTKHRMGICDHPSSV
jgi:hypothetical protein